MATDSDQAYHLARAQAETILADRAQFAQAAEAHRRLAALHMERLADVRSASIRSDEDRP
jgi:hypothetical protein